MTDTEQPDTPERYIVLRIANSGDGGWREAFGPYNTLIGAQEAREKFVALGPPNTVWRYEVLPLQVPAIG